jgi:hypothetical protein
MLLLPASRARRWQAASPWCSPSLPTFPSRLKLVGIEPFPAAIPCATAARWTSPAGRLLLNQHVPHVPQPRLSLQVHRKLTAGHQNSSPPASSVTQIAPPPPTLTSELPCLLSEKMGPPHHPLTPGEVGLAPRHWQPPAGRGLGASLTPGSKPARGVGLAKAKPGRVSH